MTRSPHTRLLYLFPMLSMHWFTGVHFGSQMPHTQGAVCIVVLEVHDMSTNPPN